MHQVNAKTKCDIVAEHIVRDIAKGVYPMGSQLPNENDLCIKYGVSRITVRESLKRLSSMGIVSIQQGRGTFINSVDLGTFMSSLLPLIEFADFDVETIYDARLYLETGTCRLAARSCTEEDAKVLFAYTVQIDEAIEHGDIPRIVELDTLFHVKIAEISGNQILKASIMNLEQLSIAFAATINKLYVLMEGANENHKKIAQAISLKDEDAAEKAIVEHTLNAKDFLNERLS